MTLVGCQSVGETFLDNRARLAERLSDLRIGRPKFWINHIFGEEQFGIRLAWHTAGDVNRTKKFEVLRVGNKMSLSHSRFRLLDGKGNNDFTRTRKLQWGKTTRGL